MDNHSIEELKYQEYVRKQTEQEIEDLDEHSKAVFFSMDLGKQEMVMEMVCEFRRLYELRKTVDFLDRFDQIMG